MKNVYDKLNKMEFFNDKMKLSEPEDFISIDFHEYLHLDVCDDVIILNKGLMHWHPDDDEDIIQDVTDIANEDFVYIESRGFFTRPRKWDIRICDNALRILEKEVFEQRKETYLSKKHLRIYTGKIIIKRSAK